MKRTSIRHAAAITLVAATLALAAPTQALGWPEWAPASGLVHAAWSWLAGLWAAPQHTEPQEDHTPIWEKSGAGCDPMGQPVCQNQSVMSGADPDGG